jgi:membrane-associated phospholipid phosphatase
LLAVFALDPARRILLPRVVAMALGGGLLADTLKMLVARTRPRDFNLAGSISDTFGPLFPLGTLASGEQGFPSAHMATAFGLTAGLIWLYPRGRWLFALFAILAGAQRLSSEAHFLSDVVWGAAAGCIAAGLFLPGGLLALWFDRLEAWLGSRWQRTDGRNSPTASSDRRPESQRSDRAA